MIDLENAIKPLLPEIASRIHYKALFELMTIEPAIWITLYHKLSSKIAEFVCPSGSEIYEMCIAQGLKTQQAQTTFIILQLKRHLRRIVQLAAYNNGGILSKR